MTRIALLVGLVVLLAGCSSDTSDRASVSSQTIGLVAGTIEARRQERNAPPPAEPTQAIVSQINEPLLFARRDTGQQGGMLLEADRPPYKVWRGVDNVGFVMQGGVLVSTRGLGPDLYSADPGILPDRLRRREAGPVARLHRRLDGVDTMVTRRYYCTLTLQETETILIAEIPRSTRRLEESCRAVGGATGADLSAEPVFENVYWVGDDATVWRSRQWLGPELGYVRIDQLIK